MTLERYPKEALQRMIDDVEKKGANGVVSMRFTTSMIMQNAAEVLAYGTGVVLEQLVCEVVTGGGYWTKCVSCGKQ